MERDVWGRGHIEQRQNTYFVRLKHGVVESYGRVGDFDSTKSPQHKHSIDINVAERSTTDQLDAKHVVGNRLFEEGRYEEAQRVFEEIVALAPDRAEGWQNLGAIYIAREMFAQAEAPCARANALKPKDASILGLLGIAYAGQGKHGEALPILKTSAELQPKAGLTWAALAVVYHHLRMADESAAALARARSLDPKAADYVQQRYLQN